MARFFKKFPNRQYQFRTTEDGPIENVTLKDLCVKFVLSDSVRAQRDAFYPFNWRDKDRPDTLAEKYYDDDSFFWLVLLSNQIFDTFSELPKKNSVFEKWLWQKYQEDAVAEGGDGSFQDTLAYTKTTIAEYQDGDGDVIDEDTYVNLNDPDKRQVMIFQKELEENETMRKVNLLDNKYAADVENELEKKLNAIK